MSLVHQFFQIRAFLTFDMEKISWRFIALFVLSLLSLVQAGCVSVKSIDSVEPIAKLVERANSSANAPSSPLASHAEMLASINARMRADLLASKMAVSNQLNQARLTRLSAVRTLLQSVNFDSGGVTFAPVKLSNHEIIDLGRTLLNDIHKDVFGDMNKTNGQFFVDSNAVKAEMLADPDADESTARQRVLEKSISRYAQTNIFALFEAYYIAYANGKFILRDGTVLGKPTASMSFTNGVLTGSIPNDTVDGIVTVFSEAMSDSIFQTPLFFARTTGTNYSAAQSIWLTNGVVALPGVGKAKTAGLISLYRPSYESLTFTNYYQSAASIDELANNPTNTNAYVELKRPDYAQATFTNFWIPVSQLTQYESTSVPTGKFAGLTEYAMSTTNHDDYFLNGNIPTAAKIFPTEMVADVLAETNKTVGFLTKNEVQFIRTVSGLSAKQSQALGTLIFQSFGGASAGQFVFVHFSVGNSQMLSSVVAALLSSASYHTSEWTLTRLFRDYDGKDPAVNFLLEYYQTLTSVVTSPSTTSANITKAP